MAKDRYCKEDLEIILDISKAIFSTLDTGEILYLIVKKISDIMDVSRCSIIMIEKNKKTGHILATRENPHIKDLVIDLKKYPEITYAIEKEAPVIINNVEKHPLMEGVRDIIKELGIKSIMVIPIKYMEGAIWALFLRTSRKEKEFTDKERKLCEIMCSLAAVALRNSHLFEIIRKEKALLEKMAVTDDLTGLYNHRFFVKRLHEEFKRARRYGNPISCLMIDIDDFKKVNDTYGHQSGDIVLQEIGKVIKNSVRETDVVARYGGEEFAIILPHTDLEHALILADRVRKAVKNYRSSIKDMKYQITVSIGVSTAHPAINKDEKMDDLVRRADHCLYEAKSQGKDTVVGHNIY